jgi:acyl-CoA synthetase (NDP forming)
VKALFGCGRRRRKGAPVHRLERLLRPQTIAVFGGSQAAAVVEQSLKMGFAGEIWPVHPTRQEVHGIRAFRSVEDLPAAPDASFVGVNRQLTIDLVRQLARRGSGGAIAYASGFREAGDDAQGHDLQARLVAAAGHMPLVGPNCYGLINYADGALLWPDQHGGRRLRTGERGVAIITQSSNIACNLTMQARGLPIAFLMTAGNQAQTGLSGMALGLIEDDRVTSLGLHIEGFDRVAGFELLAARARELRKPIVAMKVGRSEQARKAAVSHTASLAGSDAASDAFLKRLGIARVHTIPAFLETLMLLHVAGPLRGGKLSSMSCSGGEASVMADSAAGRSVRFPPLEPQHASRVKSTLGPLVAVANPLDYHTFIWNREAEMEATFAAMIAGGFDLNLLVLDFPRGDRCSDADWWTAANAFRKALAANSAKGAIVASMAENLPEGHADRLVEGGIVPLHGIAEAIDATEAAAAIGMAWALPETAAVAGAGRNSAQPLAPVVLDEAQAKAKLRAAGLSVPEGRRAANPDEAVAAATALGFPVAVKALGLTHKSDLGAVRLGLGDAVSVREAACEMAGIGTGLHVERMVAGGVAELIVGVVSDPVFGPVMALGSGGVLVELLQDSATLLLPASRDTVEVALRGLRLFPLLDGFRGRPRADLGAAVDAVLKIAAFVLDHPGGIKELEVNPLIVRREGEGAFVADVLLLERSHGGKAWLKS